MGNGASSRQKGGEKTPGVNYPVQPTYPIQPSPQPPINPPGYNEPLHVPISFYADNVYSTSSGTGTLAQINRDLDSFDYRLTEVLDGNRYFNKVHDPSIPPAPGMIQVAFMTSQPPMHYPSTSSYTPPAYTQVPQGPPPKYYQSGENVEEKIIPGPSL